VRVVWKNCGGEKSGEVHPTRGGGVMGKKAHEIEEEGGGFGGAWKGDGPEAKIKKGARMQQEKKGEGLMRADEGGMSAFDMEKQRFTRNRSKKEVIRCRKREESGCTRKSGRKRG